jgi:molecular chaperone GrpE
MTARKDRNLPDTPEPVSEDAHGALDPDLEENLAAELPFRGDVLEAELEAARAEAAEAQDKALRARAEFENSRKRLETRHRDEVLRAGERVVAALLPILDDMERAIDHAGVEGSEVAEGLSAVHRKLLEVIGREGASLIDPLGERFDPERHQAVQTVEDTGCACDTVVEVFQRGYEMHGRVLRPAMVVVSTGGPAGE